MLWDLMINFFVWFAPYAEYFAKEVCALFILALIGFPLFMIVMKLKWDIEDLIYSWQYKDK